jgi:hypothetical protein
VAPFTDTISGLTFPDFFNNPPLHPANLVQPSLIFPVPCEFIDSSLPQVAIIRPLTDKFAGAVAAVARLPQRRASTKTLCIGCGKRLA